MFPINFRKQAPAIAHRAEHEGAVLFASDAGKAKQYWVATSIRAMYDYVFGLPVAERDCYEMLEPHLPTKLFFDLELDDGNDKGDPQTRVARMDAMQEAVIETSIAALKEKYGVDVNRADVVVLTSDGATSNGGLKASRHIIVPAYFAGVEHVKEFVHNDVLPSHQPWVKHGIDPGVYTKNRPFRFLGCHKIGSDRTLAVEGAGEAGTPSHWRLFLSTMICEPPTADTTPIERPPPAKRTAKKRGGPFTDRTVEPKSRRVGGAPSGKKVFCIYSVVFLYLISVYLFKSFFVFIRFVFCLCTVENPSIIFLFSNSS